MADRPMSGSIDLLTALDLLGKAEARVAERERENQERFADWQIDVARLGEEVNVRQIAREQAEARVAELTAERDEAIGLLREVWRIAEKKAAADWHSTAVEALPAAEARVAELEAELKLVRGGLAIPSGELTTSAPARALAAVRQEKP
jgi:hypothetical protein